MELYSRYKKVTPGGVQSNFRFESPNPLYFSSGNGPFVLDLDGNRYVDLIVGNGSVILGHNDHEVSAMVKDTIDTGLLSGYETQLSYDVASMLHQMVPSAKMVRFANSGTEAVMHAVQMVRSFTGKSRILKFEGGYHGWYDYVAYSHTPPLNRGEDRGNIVWPDFDGLSPQSSNEVSVVRYNDRNSTLEALKSLKKELAAVIIEPVAFNMGCVLPNPEFLPMLREETEKYNIPLIFDEVITGFRISPGGAQKHFGVIPDLTVLGKAIANGYSLSAVVGREDIMNITAPGKKSSYAGTYNGNQVNLAAAKATLSKLKDGNVQEYLSEKTSYLKKVVDTAAQDLGIKAKFNGIGGQFQIYFTGEEVIDFVSASISNKNNYCKFREHMKNNGVLFHPSYLFHHGITYSHGSEVIEKLADDLINGMRAVTT